MNIYVNFLKKKKILYIWLKKCTTILSAWNTRLISKNIQTNVHVARYYQTMVAISTESVPQQLGISPPTTMSSL